MLILVLSCTHTLILWPVRHISPPLLRLAGQTNSYSTDYYYSLSLSLSLSLTHTHTHTHIHTCTIRLTTALTRAKSIPMMAETQNMSRKSPRDTRSTIPGLAVLVAYFNMVLGVGKWEEL